MTPEKEQELLRRLQEVDRKPMGPVSRGVEKNVSKDDPDFSKPVSIRNLFFHHDAHPVVLDFALLKTFGPEWYSWEPETIWASIKETFKTEISELTRAKVQTIKTIHVSDLTWSSWIVFEKVIQGLNNNVPRFDIMQAPTMEQLYVGIDILDDLRKEDFEPEVKLYIAAAALNEDVCFVPPPLDFVQVEVTQPKYECLDCGNKDSALFHDGICDTCSLKFHPENMLDFQPHPDVAEKRPGRNLKLLLTYNPDEVQKRWAQVSTKSIADAGLEMNDVDVQVAKLLIARDYMNLRRRQLAEQLVTLRSWLGTA